MGEALHVWLVNGSALLVGALLLTAIVRWVKPVSLTWWLALAGLGLVVCASLSFNVTHHGDHSLPPVLRGNSEVIG